MPTMEPLLARLLRTAQAPLEATIESLRDPSLFGLLVHESPFHDLLMVERGPGATSLAASGTALQKQVQPVTNARQFARRCYINRHLFCRHWRKSTSPCWI